MVIVVHQHTELNPLYVNCVCDSLIKTTCHVHIFTEYSLQAVMTFILGHFFLSFHAEKSNSSIKNSNSGPEFAVFVLLDLLNVNVEH